MSGQFWFGFGSAFGLLVVLYLVMVVVSNVKLQRYERRYFESRWNSIPPGQRFTNGISYHEHGLGDPCTDRCGERKATARDV